MGRKYNVQIKKMIRHKIGDVFTYRCMLECDCNLPFLA